MTLIHCYYCAKQQKQRWNEEVFRLNDLSHGQHSLKEQNPTLPRWKHPCFFSVYFNYLCCFSTLESIIFKFSLIWSYFIDYNILHSWCANADIFPSDSYPLWMVRVSEIPMYRDSNVDVDRPLGHSYHLEICWRLVTMYEWTYLVMYKIGFRSKKTLK